MNHRRFIMKKSLLNGFSIRKGVFIPLAAIYVVVIILGLVSPDAFASAENAVVGFAAGWFGWLYQIITIVLIIICVWVLVSKKVGGIRIGGENAKPIMSKWNWFAISLCGGIATGIVFWGIAEPITHFMDGIPGLVEGGGTRMSALYALSTCYMHWGLPLYAYYAAAGLLIGVCVYNLGQPYNVSSSLYPILGEKTKGGFGSFIDLLCVFGIAGGVSASLGVASMQLGSGIGLLAKFTPTSTHWLIIMAAIVATFIISSYTGINHGVRWLSDKNAKIYIGLLVYVFFFAQTKEVLAMSTESMGFFAQNWIIQDTYLGVMADGTETAMWPTWWTINYWSFMIAYTPLIGMFLAKIAQGRTLREFSLYNFILPGVFGMIWFAIFGSASIYMQANGAGIYEEMNEKGLEATVFAFFSNLPLSTVLSIIFMITVFLSVVTLCDSMTTTISSITLNGDTATKEPPSSIKVVWGVIMASLAFINIAVAGITGNSSGINATKLLAITCAFPLLFVVVAMAGSAFKLLFNYQKNYGKMEEENCLANQPDYDPVAEAKE